MLFLINPLFVRIPSYVKPSVCYVYLFVNVLFTLTTGRATLAHRFYKLTVQFLCHSSIFKDNSDLQIGVRGRLRVRGLISEHFALRKFSPSKPKARAQYEKLVLVVVLVLQSECR